MIIIIGVILLLVGVSYGKPLEAEHQCPGYSACHALDPQKVNVHLIPHSHDDVGWLKTIDEYYYQNVQYIISSVVTALLNNPTRRFIQVETAFFYMWWNNQNDEKKNQVKELINQGRLEIINGAWSMNDEADVHYQSVIDQYTLGLRFIEDVLGKCARPRVGWQIDPFGHSREQASLLSQFGMDGVFFARIDYRDKENRLSTKTMEMLWTGSASLGSDSNIFASTLFSHYSAPGGFCFDITCNDPPIVTDTDLPEYNWEERVQVFAQWIYNQAQFYPSNNILVPMGDDFMWQAAEHYYINVDLLIEGFKKFNPKISNTEFNVIYSTPSCYTKAVHDYIEENNITLNVKTDDFFPYADSATTVWSGYFTSRPTSKRFERFSNNLLQIAKQITALGGKPYGTNFALSNAIGIMQHHDAITGTEKQAVEKDYHRLLSKGIEEAISDISSSFSNLLGLQVNLNLKSCLLSNVSICDESDKDEFTVVIYNPLARKTSHYIQIPVNDGTWKVTGPTGEDIECYLTEPIRDFHYITNVTGQKILEKVLFFRAENLPPLGYKTYHFNRTSFKSMATNTIATNVGKIGFEDKYINIDPVTGLLKAITLNGITMKVQQEMLFYESDSSSGAYIFSPDSTVKDAVRFGDVKNIILINNGNLVREVKQKWNSWVSQIIRVYKEEDFIEFDWVVGPTNISDHIGKEIITRYTTELNTDGIFYTDSNGREMIFRKKDYRPTYNFSSIEPQADNYYPVNTRILVKDGQKEFAVLPDRSEGGASLSSGEIELMLSRTTLSDDHRGLGESLIEKEYKQLLVARGSHFVTLGYSKDEHNGRTMAAVERDIVQRKLLQPWVFYSTEDISIKEQSFLQEELPLNVHLLTLEKWNNINNSFLIRLEHIFEKNEDSNLSKEITVDLSNIFKTFKIKSLKEYMLAANTPLEENSRLKWSQINETEVDSSSLLKKNRLSRDETNLTISLAPMQIRTFVATIEKVL